MTRGPFPSPSSPVGVLRRAAVVSVPLDPAALLALTAQGPAGGQVLFVGMVRDNDGGHAVSGLDYEAHPGAEHELRRVAEQVAASPGLVAVAVEHRIGALAVGDLAVVVAVSAAHRGAAFEACRRLIDTLKAEVPIWKRQHHPDGDAGWVGLP